MGQACAREVRISSCCRDDVLNEKDIVPVQQTPAPEPIKVVKEKKV